MLKHFLNLGIGRVPEVVGVEAAINSLLTLIPAQNVNSPSLVQIASILGISDDHLAHVLAAFAVFAKVFFNLVLRPCFKICKILWSVVLLVKVVDYGLDWAVKCVSFLPVRVGHPEFFPCLIRNGLVMASHLQKMSMAKGEVCGGHHSFKWPSHYVLVLLE